MKKKIKNSCKVGCVFLMVVVAMLFHLEIGRNHHRKDAPHFNSVIMAYRPKLRFPILKNKLCVLEHVRTQSKELIWENIPDASNSSISSIYYSVSFRSISIFSFRLFLFFFFAFWCSDFGKKKTSETRMTHHWRLFIQRNDSSRAKFIFHLPWVFYVYFGEKFHLKIFSTFH